MSTKAVRKKSTEELLYYADQPKQLREILRGFYGVSDEAIDSMVSKLEFFRINSRIGMVESELRLRKIEKSTK